MDLHEEFKKVEGITRRTHTIKATMVYLNKNLHTIAPIIYRDERGYPEVSVRPHKGTLGQYVEAEKGYMNTEIDDTAEPDRKSTRLNSSHRLTSRMPSSA